MKKKIIVFSIIIIIIIIAVVFGIKKINESKINYEISKVNSFKFFEYYENSRYGVINREGTTVISAKYKKVIIPNPEKDLFVCYDENEDTKIFNSHGEEIFTEYDKVEPIKLKNVASVLCYEKSVLKYEKDGLYGLIDYNGKKITKNIYNSIENLQSAEGKLLVSKDSKYGVINIKGTSLVDIEFDSIKTDGYYNYQNENYIKSGFIVSKTTDDGYKYGYIDYKGKKILDTNYSEITRIQDLEDVYLIVSEKGKYGLYKENKEIISHEYQSIIYDESGMLLLQKNKNYGMADLKGNTKIPVDYANIETRGIYIYANNQKENLVYDNQGNKVDVNFNKSIYETENEQYRISTIVNNNITYYGIENKEGNTLVKEGYDYIEYAYENYFVARDENGKLGVINANGKPVIDFKYDSLQKIKGKDMIQILNEKNDKTHIYSPELKVICKMKNANIDVQDDYIRVYNNKEEKYFDNSGKEISKNSEVVKNNEMKGLPSSINEYVKTQYSLDNAFYVKK